MALLHHGGQAHLEARQRRGVRKEPCAAVNAKRLIRERQPSGPGGVTKEPRDPKGAWLRIGLLPYRRQRMRCSRALLNDASVKLRGRAVPAALSQAGPALGVHHRLVVLTANVTPNLDRTESM